MKKVDWIEVIKEALDPDDVIRVYTYLAESTVITDEDKEKMAKIVEEIEKEKEK